MQLLKKWLITWKFKEYSVNVGHLNKAYLRSNDIPLTQGISSKDDGDKNVVSFLAIAADRKSIEMIWFIKVIKAECVSENAELDDYGHSIAKRVT